MENYISDHQEFTCSQSDYQNDAAFDASFDMASPLTEDSQGADYMDSFESSSNLTADEKRKRRLIRNREAARRFVSLLSL